MLSHVVISVIQVFPSFVILSLACVFVRDGLPSVEMWFDCGEDRCYGLSRVGMVETVGFRQVMWFVMLESANDQILRLDTLGQHVPPHVQYRTACWGWHHTLWSFFVTYFVNCLNHMVQEGTFVREILALQAGTVCSENRSKAWRTPIVDLCNNM
jgi:hypothetical protein